VKSTPRAKPTSKIGAGVLPAKNPTAIAADIRKKVFNNVAVSQSLRIARAWRSVHAYLSPLSYGSRRVLSLSSSFGGIKIVFGRRIRLVLIRVSNNSDASSPILHVR